MFYLSLALSLSPFTLSTLSTFLCKAGDIIIVLRRSWKRSLVSPHHIHSCSNSGDSDDSDIIMVDKNIWIISIIYYHYWKREQIR